MINPATGEVVVEAELAGPADVDSAVRAARAAFADWSTATPGERSVTFPLVFPGILAAALLSFSLSFDDFIITNLNAGTSVTFPMFVWGAAQRDIPPQINVIGTAMFVISLALVVGGEMNSRRRAKAMS